MRRASLSSVSRARSPASPTTRRRGPSPARVALDTLVVAPAGNDGPAGPGFGSVAGPGGSPGRAHRRRRRHARAHPARAASSLRSGLRVLARPACCRSLGAVAPGARSPPRPRARRARAAPRRTSPGSTRTSSTGAASASSRAAPRSFPPAALPRRPPQCGRARRRGGRASRTERGFPPGALGARRGHSCAGRRVPSAVAREAARDARQRPGRGVSTRHADAHVRRTTAQRSRRRVLVARARVRRPCEAGRRRARRRHRDRGAGRARDGEPALRNRQRIERRGGRRRRCRGAARAGAALARRARTCGACSSATRAPVAGTLA